MAPTIELDGLEVQLGGRTILRNLTGVLNSRAIGLLGPNGAGKSTLINTLLGFHRPSKGSVRILGLDSRRDGKALRALVGYMPETDAFIAKMSGVRFVRYMAELSGLPPDQAIARGPKLLILDEPTNGLDPPARKRLLELVCEIRQASDICLLLSSHLLRDVEETCDQVLILRDGRIASICDLAKERRGNRKFLEMETCGTEPAFAAALQSLGCECALFGNGGMKVVLPDAVEIRDVYKVAAERGVQIRRMNQRRDSLQDIFLNAMEQSGGTSGRI